jgi:hypothetical protein
MDDAFGNRRTERRHTRRQPGRHAAAVQGQSAMPERFMQSLSHLNDRYR